MSWRDDPIVGFDTETTSADPETARVVTACVGVASSEGGWQPRNWLLRQAEPIPAKATALHGITTEQANRDGSDPQAALVEIRGNLHEAWSNGWPVAGHNIRHDFTVLDRECRRFGLGGFEVRGPVIDTLVVDKAVDRYRKGLRTLTAMTAHYGIVLTAAEAHGAEPDALAAARLAWKLAGQYVPAGEIPEHGSAPHPGGRFRVGDVPLGELHAFQVEAHAAQRVSFAAYLAKKGETLDDEGRGWPMTPWETLQ